MSEIAEVELTHPRMVASSAHTLRRCFKQIAEGGRSERDPRDERGGPLDPGDRRRTGHRPEHGAPVSQHAVRPVINTGDPGRGGSIGHRHPAIAIPFLDSDRGPEPAPHVNNPGKAGAGRTQGFSCFPPASDSRLPLPPFPHARERCDPAHIRIVSGPDNCPRTCSRA